MTKVKMVSYAQNGKREVQKFVMFPTVMNGQTYMNLKARGKTVGQQGNAYQFFMYELQGADKLIVWRLNHEIFAEAINDGTLKGEIWQKGFFYGVKLTDSSEKLADFLTTIDRKKLLLEDKHYLVRR